MNDKFKKQYEESNEKYDVMLSHEERIEESQHHEKHIEYLDAKWAMLSPLEQEKALTAISTTINVSVRKCFQKFAKLVTVQTSKPIDINISFMSSQEARRSMCGVQRICAGFASAEDGTIWLINHLAFAPKEVIKNVVVHECLHLIYPMIDQKSKDSMTIRNGIKMNYSTEMQEEEEWVQRMEEKLCGKEDFLAAWGTAVGLAGDKWRDMYYKIKKAKQAWRS